MAGTEPSRGSEVARAAAERAAELAMRSQQARERLRQVQGEVRRVAAQISETESRAAAAFRRVAARADEQGRADDAARLRNKAHMAEGVAQHEAEEARGDR